MRVGSKTLFLLSAWIVLNIINLTFSSILYNVINGPALMGLIFSIIVSAFFIKKEWIIFGIGFVLSITLSIMAYTTY